MTNLSPLEQEIAVPFHFESTGSVALQSNPVEIARQHLLAILMTGLGERVMRPGFGSVTRNYVFDINDEIRQAELAEFLRQAVSRLEPAIELLNVTPGPGEDDDATMVIRIDYRVRPSEDVHTAVALMTTTGAVQEVGLV